MCEDGNNKIDFDFRDIVKCHIYV
ncbi:uncharacterized protein METZ01_LOCUS147174 [marine metagenome]|uniref:Uncharacterized protein n=1 Tax=marine metagenome TaxID=408172 RepID=A0A381ZYM1_9ZZZZ